MTFATYEGTVLKFKGDLLGCKTPDPFLQWLHLPYEGPGKSEKLCSLNTPQPRSSQLLSETVFLVLIDANCSFFAFICSGAHFPQAPIESSMGLLRLKDQRALSFHRKDNSAEMEFMAKKTITPFHSTRHNHGFRYLECASRLIFTLFKNKFSSAQTKRLTTVKNVLVPEA